MKNKWLYDNYMSELARVSKAFDAHMALRKDIKDEEMQHNLNQMIDYETDHMFDLCLRIREIKSAQMPPYEKMDIRTMHE